MAGRVKKKTAGKQAQSRANIGYEAQLWQMTGIERGNPQLKGVLPKDYARLSLDKTRFGRVYDVCSGSWRMFAQSVEFIRALASGLTTPNRCR